MAAITNAPPPANAVFAKLQIPVCMLSAGVEVRFSCWLFVGGGMNFFFFYTCDFFRQREVLRGMIGCLRIFTARHKCRIGLIQWAGGTASLPAAATGSGSPPVGAAWTSPPHRACCVVVKLHFCGTRHWHFRPVPPRVGQVAGRGVHPNWPFLTDEQQVDQNNAGPKKSWPSG